MGSGEELEVGDNSLDLVTICQALHWLDLPAFRFGISAERAAWMHRWISQQLDEVVYSEALHQALLFGKISSRRFHTWTQRSQ